MIMLQSRSTKPGKSCRDIIKVRPESRLNAGYALSLGAEDQWGPGSGKKFLFPPGLLLSISVHDQSEARQGKGRGPAKGTTNYQPGFQNRPDTSEALAAFRFRPSAVSTLTNECLDALSCLLHPDKKSCHLQERQRKNAEYLR